jgi:deoxyribodipyrimidine photo-lyase
MRPTILDRMQQRVRHQTDGLERGGIGSAFATAIEGKTGIDAFDHWAKELVETGYLHNHARMWFASIWIFTLRLPWELGADFFMRHLLDGDAASNTLSWRWVAGLHTRGKNYVAQRDNINRYSDGRFFPKGLVKAAAPLDETATDAQRPVPLADEAPGEPFFLLLSDDDLGIDTLALDRAMVRSVAIVNTASRRSANKVADLVHQFADEAAADVLIRALSVFPNAQASGTVFQPGSLADLVKLVGDSGCKHVVMPYATIGSAQEVMGEANTLLAAEGITVHRIRRRFDSLCWPHAGRGFFQFKDKIPTLLSDLGIVAGAADLFGPRERQPIVMRQR